MAEQSASFLPPRGLPPSTPRGGADRIRVHAAPRLVVDCPASVAIKRDPACLTGHPLDQIPCSTTNEGSAATPHPRRHLGHRRARPTLSAPRPTAARPPTTQPAPIPTSPSPTPSRGHRTQIAEDRPVSSVNWHTTVDHLVAHDIGQARRVRSFFTGIQANGRRCGDCPSFAVRCHPRYSS